MIRTLRAGALALIFLTGAARGDDLADFNAAVEAAAAHNRVAIAYLGAGNIDLAAIELERLQAAWAEVNRRFAGRRPQAFAGNPAYVTSMTDIATRLVTADMMLNSGRPRNARDALIGIRDDLYNLRQSAGVPVLADCVRDAGKTMDALMAYDGTADFAQSGQAITDAAARYRDTIARCDRMADPATRGKAEFRRLIDDAKASLARIPEAVATRDADLLHRLLGELHALDRLLAFRFG
jgi:hypothetical protein